MATSCFRVRATTLLWVSALFMFGSIVRFAWYTEVVPRSDEYLSTSAALCSLRNLSLLEADDTSESTEYSSDSERFTSSPESDEDRRLTSTPESEDRPCSAVNFSVRAWGKAPTLEEYTCRLEDTCQSQQETWPRLANRTDLCPCIPPGLVGDVKVDAKALLGISWRELEERLYDVGPGGEWRPEGCHPRRRVAVIIPYRDREQHLRAFMAHMHPILQRQLLHYRIFVVEQNLPYTFNKASIMNIGYVEAMRIFKPDCVLFNDVDTLIDRDDNMVICEKSPIHFAAYSNRHKHTLREYLFGAAVLFSKDVFESINGFANVFFGWGAEDDDIRNRIHAHKMQIYKAPLSIGQCTILKHHRDALFTKEGHPDRTRVLGHMEKHKIWHKVDGLNSLRYELVEQEERPLYTWILADLKYPEIDTKDKIPQYYVKKVLRGAKEAFDKKPRKFSVSMGHECSGGKPSGEHMSFSRVTCHYLCEKSPDCTAVEYHTKPTDQLDSYCVLRNNCTDTEPAPDIEVHTKQ